MCELKAAIEKPYQESTQHINELILRSLNTCALNAPCISEPAYDAASMYTPWEPETTEMASVPKAERCHCNTTQTKCRPMHEQAVAHLQQATGAARRCWTMMREIKFDMRSFYQSAMKSSTEV